MTHSVTDPAELRLLSNILALVLDEQPGQASAALETLRRKAAQRQITGGALKNLFDRIAADVAVAEHANGHLTRIETHRLRQDLDAARVQASRLAAENGALHLQLAQTEQRVLRYCMHEAEQRSYAAQPARPFTPPPRPRHTAGLLAGMLLSFVAIGLEHDHAGVAAWPPPQHATGQYSFSVPVGIAPMTDLAADVTAEVPPPPLER
jgi:hypothetical protein